MTEHHDNPPDDCTPIDVRDSSAPLAPWMLALADDVTYPAAEAVPRDMMWARIQRQRRDAVNRHHSRSRQPWWLARAAGIAAVLIGGVGVGRYLIPPENPVLSPTQVASQADSIAALGIGPDGLAALPFSNDPAHVAMEEHLGRTVALLTTVRDNDPALGPGADVGEWARELLGTTRMLIDEPQLSDARTRRLLQDVELVLVQIIQARGSVPATQRAPTETMRETNLLLRVRAATSAMRTGDELTFGGDP